MHILVRHVYTCQRVSVKALLIILPKRSLIESSQKKGKQKVKKQREDDTAHRCKNHKNKCLKGPFKSLGSPGKYPLSPPIKTNDDVIIPAHGGGGGAK